MPEFFSGEHLRVKCETVEIPATDWNLMVAGNTRDVSNGRDGRYRVAGLIDARVTFNLVWDNAADMNPTDPTAINLRHNSIVSLNLWTDDAGSYADTNSFRGDFIIDSINPADAEGAELRMQAVALLQDGSTFLYPAYA